jgi:Tol biopolymer transport system component
MNAADCGNAAATPTQLTTDTHNDTQPAWRPDGTKLAFATNRTGNVEIFVMNADGSQQTRCTTIPGDDRNPAWSPDGTQLIFTSRRDGNSNIYRITYTPSGGCDAASLTALTTNTSEDVNAQWWPGPKIAFSSSRDGNEEVYLMNADGTSQTRCTVNAAADDQVAWSADGTQLVFVSTRDGNQEVYRMNAADCGNPSAAAPARLTTNAADDFWPDWKAGGGVNSREPPSLPLC